MQYKIIGDSDCPMAQISLCQNEKIKIERGCMAFMSNTTIEGQLNSNKKGFMGALSAIGRSMTSGESMFITQAYGQCDGAYIGIAPPIPGKITCLHLTSNQQYCLNTGAFLACEDSVNYQMVKQNIGKAFFAGTGGFFIMQTTGVGDMLISSFGDILALDVTPDRPITIDNEHVVAWDSSLSYDIHVASGIFGFTSGEGLVNEFKGNGRVYIQSRNLHNLADAIIPYLPTPSSD